jgi:hypothetical protein
MKKLIHELVFGKNALVSGLIALSVVASVALGCNCNKKFGSGETNSVSYNSSVDSNSASNTSFSNDSLPSNSVVEGLVKDTTDKFKDAVQSGNFSTIYNDASTDFQSTYTLSEMTTAFKSYTDKKSLVVPILNKVPGTNADFSRPPSIRTEKGLSILVASGKFATKPYNVRYDYEYVMRGGQWKLLKLVINIP